VINTNCIIRKMTAEDLDQIMAIEVEAFPVPWSRDSYLSELQNDFATYIVCDYEGAVVGYAGIWVVFEEAHITNVAVAKYFRGSGMGKLLMQHIEKVARQKKAKRIFLEVRPSNCKARQLYKKMNFIATGLRKAYYSDNGEDAIVMTRFL